MDATALAGVLALGWMARATARRVRHGPADSVWSVHQAPPFGGRIAAAQRHPPIDPQTQE